MLFVKEFKLSGVFLWRFFQVAERCVDVREISAVTHRVDREDISSPHLLVALLEVAHLVVLLCNLTNTLDA